MYPSHDTAHVDEGLALLIEQFKKRANITGFLSVYLRRLQEIEDFFWDVLNKRLFANATGVQLDTIGDLVGEPRLRRSDADYKIAIAIRIKVNRSKGRTADVIEIAMLANAPSLPSYIDYQFLNFEVDAFSQAGERYVAQLLSKTRAAGSYGLLVASALDPSSLLFWDDAVSPVAGTMTVSDSVSGTGNVAASGYGLPGDYTGIVLTLTEGASDLIGSPALIGSGLLIGA